MLVIARLKPNTEIEKRGNYGILIGQQILPIISAMPVMLSLCWVLLLRLRAYICITLKRVTTIKWHFRSQVQSTLPTLL